MPKALELQATGRDKQAFMDSPAAAIESMVRATKEGAEAPFFDQAVNKVHIA